MLFPHAQSERVNLKPAGTDDGRTAYDVLFSLGRTALPTVDTYLERFGKGVAAAFLVELRDTGETVGLCELSEPSPAGHVQAAVHIRRGQDRSVAADAALLTVNFAFAMWRIRKVYFQTHEADLESLGFHGERAKLVRREAVLADHLYFQGRTWDMHVHSIQREMWDAQGAEIVNGIRPGGAV
ncbi:GNAT family N-acetyltransferase [Herbidospora galbida]|uniref:GNAT family N-acetyltransferase n=1 Tax=Herbidospora galbida TaxID=2575442 RepID=A0A4U3MFK2_9ACTN|nr:GNAT family protein [Herbidospora galbida]TKK87212.1 GNAT family N-acetyltransferase [Herbidospora galbida]